MRYAVISDVHANEAALRTVLMDAADARADRMICLGDVLGYGPEPVSTLELAYRSMHVCLAGNHDAAVAGLFPVDDFTRFAAAAVRRHREALSQKACDWLSQLPYVCEVGGFACAHGDFAAPERFNYILEPEDALPSFDARPEQLMFVGHTHRPAIFAVGESGVPLRLDVADFTLEDGKRYIVNPGSVGYPRNGECRSSYCIYDDQTGSVEFRSLPFDLDSYAAKMRGQGLDEVPWMLERAVERQRPTVRGGVRFGADKRPAEPFHSSIQSTPPSSRSTHRAAIVASCIFAAAVTCGIAVFGRKPAETAKCDPAPAKEVRENVPPFEPAPPAKPVSQNVFGPEIKLAHGWTYAVTNPEKQKVSVGFDKKKKANVFLIEHKVPLVARLTKNIELNTASGRVEWSINVLTKPFSRDKKSFFEFTAHLVFHDAKGAQVGKTATCSSKWTSNRKWPVPAGAVRAVLSIDCRCWGVFKLLVPKFGLQPHAPQQRGKK